MWDKIVHARKCRIGNLFDTKKKPGKLDLLVLSHGSGISMETEEV